MGATNLKGTGLKELLERLDRRARGAKADYRVPAQWAAWDAVKPAGRGGEVRRVNPYALLADCLRWLDGRSQPVAGGRSLSQARGVKSAGTRRVRDGAAVRHAGDWIAGQTMYAAMVRTSAAWDHDGNGRLTTGRYSEPGTFLKMILLLPHLHQLGITTLYLLPLVKVSQLFRKGELGCPYATKDFYSLDPGQHDKLAEAVGLDIAAEFSLFVRLAHGLGMRVVLDIAPRTAARDSDWILDHPDWFYWIDRRFAKTFGSPRLPQVSYGTPIADRLHEIYGDAEVQAYLHCFRFAPSVTAPAKWARFAASAKRKPPRDLLAEIARHFGVITPPGFSDVINDRQPPWTDVTFLRLFLDHPAAAVKHLPDPRQQPPYVLFDTIKASLFPGRKPNLPMWRKLAGILPFYQTFGVDGSRVDMAHALPAALERMILDQPRRRDPDFCLLAEDLGTHNHANARTAGYNMIVGPCWYRQPRIAEGEMDGLLAELPRLKVPITAAVELPDTPRAVVRPGGVRFARQALLIDFFLPNAVPMVTTGQELAERQPMNLGLDLVPPGRDALPASDPQAGRLAFFDPYALHWTQREASAMTAWIRRLAELRRRWLGACTVGRRFAEIPASAKAAGLLGWCYPLGRKRELLILINPDQRRPRVLPRAAVKHRLRAVEVLAEVSNRHPMDLDRGRLTGTLGPSDAKLILLHRA